MCTTIVQTSECLFSFLFYAVIVAFDGNIHYTVNFKPANNVASFPIGLWHKEKNSY